MRSQRRRPPTSSGCAWSMGWFDAHHSHEAHVRRHRDRSQRPPTPCTPSVPPHPVPPKHRHPEVRRRTSTALLPEAPLRARAPHPPVILSIARRRGASLMAQETGVFARPTRQPARQGPKAPGYPPRPWEGVRPLEGGSGASRARQRPSSRPSAGVGSPVRWRSSVCWRPPVCWRSRRPIAPRILGRTVPGVRPSARVTFLSSLPSCDEPPNTRHPEACPEAFRRVRRPKDLYRTSTRGLCAVEVLRFAQDDGLGGAAYGVQLRVLRGRIQGRGIRTPPLHATSAQP